MADAPSELSAVLSGRLFESVTLITPDELTDDERSVIPDWWLEAVRLPAGDGMAHAVAAWQSVLPDALPGFYALLQEHGLGVFLGRSPSERKPLLAYAVARPSSEIVCWYGFAPTPQLRHSTLDLSGLPADPRTLYTELHDGFKRAFPFHNGFVCSAEWFVVGEDLDAGSAEVVGAATAPDLDELVSLFFDFGAASVCVELGSDATDGGWVVSDGQVQPVADVFATIDRWMASLIES